MGMAGFDVIDRDQGQAHVARFLEQAIKRSLVGYGAMDDGGSVTVVGEGQPVEPGGPPGIEVPLRRISYRPGLSWWPVGISLMVLLLLSLAWMDPRRRCERF